MAAIVRPFTALHDAIEDLIRCAAAHVEAVDQRTDTAEMWRSFAALQAAVEALTRAQAAHATSLDGTETPTLAVLGGGLPS